MSTADGVFLTKLREQIAFLQNGEYAYDELRIYVAGIAEPWSFGPDDEFEFDGGETLTARVGPTADHENAGVPEFAFPLRHVVATELAVGDA